MSANTSLEKTGAILTCGALGFAGVALVKRAANQEGKSMEQRSASRVSSNRWARLAGWSAALAGVVGVVALCLGPSGSASLGSSASASASATTAVVAASVPATVSPPGPAPAV